jgi:hypothetical protein
MMIYEYELNDKNNTLINYLGNVQELWIDKWILYYGYDNLILICISK